MVLADLRGCDRKRRPIPGPGACAAVPAAVKLAALVPAATAVPSSAGSAESAPREPPGRCAISRSVISPGTSRRPLLLGHPVPPRASAPLTIGLPRQDQRGPGRGFRVPHAQASWGGRPLYPRGAAVFLRPSRGRRSPPATPSGQPLSPRSNCPPRGARNNGTSARVHWCSPIQPSPHLWPRDGTGALGLSLKLRTPAGRARKRTSRAGTSLEHLTRSHIFGNPNLQPTDPLTTCDLTSQPRLLVSSSRPRV